jgi:histone acetyltransferase
VGEFQKVLGGVCYRPNPDQGFIEIAFLAISSLEQVKGYGTRLMNKLKDHCKEKNLNYFLTYADNNAIGYFKKQGFSTSVKMPIEKWKEYIKDYDGGTLMEAYCSVSVDYSNLSEILKKQKECLHNILGRFLGVKTRQKYSELEKVVKKYKKDINSLNEDESDSEGSERSIQQAINNEKLFYAIPGVEESGYSYEEYEKFAKNENNNTNFYTQCRNIINKIKSNKNSWPFLKPVDSKEVPDYYEVIKDPMDIQTLEAHLEKGDYKQKAQFVKDVKKIFTNAKSYNKPFTIYHKYAKDIETMIEDDLKSLKEA